MFNRTRWSAIGAAVAVTIGGGLALPSARATNTNGGGSGVVFVPVAPCRLFDTRSAAPVGPRTTPLGPGDTNIQSVTGTNGNCTIPAGASAVAMNVTAVNATATSFLTIWPADVAQPLASNLNWVAGSPPTPNKVDVKLSADGRIKLFNNGGTVDVIGDVVGYYADHNHDDRYYTKDETDQHIADAAESLQISIMPPSVLTIRQLAVPGNADLISIGNCVGNSGTLTEGRIPITVPYPGLQFSVGVNVLDGTGIVPMTVSLVKLTRTDTGLAPTVLDDANFPGDQTTKVLNVTLDSGVGQTIDGSGSYEVSITGLDNGHNAYCGGALLVEKSSTSPVISS